MTLQESVRAKTIWAAKVVAFFVFFGGAVGGAVVGLVLSVISITTQLTHFDLAWLTQVPLLVLVASLYGVAIGLPASLVTGAVYVGMKAMRSRWWITTFGVLVSAAWGVLLMGGLASGPAALETYATTVSIFAFVGGVATALCFELLVLWRLQSPTC